MSAANDLALVSLRPMLETDLPAIMEIELRCYEFPWSEKIYRDCLMVGYGCWVVEYAQKVVGYGIMSAAAGEAHILNICISETYRRDGLGRHLFNHLVRLAEDHHVSSIFLEVRESNLGAYRLYEQEGFIDVGTRKNYYPAKEGREDAIIMAKELIIRDEKE